MICNNCKSSCRLKFNAKKTKCEQFTWVCSNNPACSAEFPYIIPSDRFDYANNDFTKTINTFNNISMEKRTEIESEIKVQMVEILNHFIECTWGAHYNTLFDRIIKVYLDDPTVLDFVLKSEVIKKDIINGKSGAKMFPMLFEYLKTVNSQRIQNYLDDEFDNYLLNSSRSKNNL